MSKPDEAEIKVLRVEGKSMDEVKAFVSLPPETLSVAVLARWQPISDPPVVELSKQLQRQTKALRTGDMSHAEDMLLSQAHALEGLFTSLASRAVAANSVAVMEVYLPLAFKAQNQSRASLQTLGELKAPKQVAFVGQANIGQQVQMNNGAKPARASEKNKKQPNELLEVDHEQRLDTRTPSASGAVDSELEAAGKEHWPAH